MKKNILVVDDSALMRRVECDIINSDNNFQATDVCRDGLEAYEKIKSTKYDGVVLDVNMPQHGWSTAARKVTKRKNQGKCCYGQYSDEQGCRYYYYGTRTWCN